MTGLCDTWQRQINYLRVSVTDHCNLSCIYCSANSVPHLSHDDILRYEDIQRVVQVAASMGINKVRLTGGEPLLKPQIDKLVRMIARIGTLTTDGSDLFAEVFLREDFNEALNRSAGVNERLAA